MLPRSRNFTYGAGSALRSADLDDLQDAVVGAKHGVVTRWFPVQVAGALTNITWHPGWLAANAGAAIIGGIPLPGLLEGTTIIGAKVRYFGTAAAGNITATCYLHTAAGADPALAAKVIVNPGAAWASSDLVLDGAYPVGHVMLAGEFLTLTALLDNNTAALAAVGLVIARD